MSDEKYVDKFAELNKLASDLGFAFLENVSNNNSMIAQISHRDTFDYKDLVKAIEINVIVSRKSGHAKVFKSEDKTIINVKYYARNESDVTGFRSFLDLLQTFMESS